MAQGDWRRAYRMAAAGMCLALAGCNAAGDNANGTAPDPVVPGGGGGGSSGALADHQLVDRNGFEKPMPAVTIGVPPGWRVASDIRWDNAGGNCSLAVASPNIRMTSPDGLEQFDILPGYLVSSYSDAIVNRGSKVGDYCVVAVADSGEKLVRDIAVPSLRRGWTILSITPVALPASVQNVSDRMRSLVPPGGSVTPYALETMLRSPDGSQVEKFFMAGIVTSPGPNPVPGMRPLVLNQNMETWAVRAPSARLASTEALARQVRASMRIDPEWKRRMDEHTEKITRPAPPSSSGSRGGSSGGQPGFDMEGWRRDQDRDDEVQRRRVDRIYDRERCVNPETGEEYYVSTSVGCP